MKNLKPNVHRLTLAEAVSWLAYGRFFTSAVLKRWQDRQRRRTQYAVPNTPSQAGGKVIKLTLDPGVSAFGKWYEVGHPNTDADEQRIPHDFLGSGVYPEPLNDTIFIDILLDKHSGAELKGYKFVELDRAEFFEALDGSKARSAQDQANAEEELAKAARIAEELEETQKALGGVQEELTGTKQKAAHELAAAHEETAQAHADRSAAQTEAQQTREELLRSQARTQQEALAPEATPQTDTNLGNADRRKTTEIRNQDLQKEADKIWGKNPEWDKPQVALKILHTKIPVSHRGGGRLRREAIERIIHKPTRAKPAP